MALRIYSVVLKYLSMCIKCTFSANIARNEIALFIRGGSLLFSEEFESGYT